MDIERYRPLFLVVTVLALPIVVLLWRLDTVTVFEAYGYPVIAVYLVWVLWAVVRGRIPIKVLMAVAFWVLSAFWLGQMAFDLSWRKDAALGLHTLTPDLYMVFVVLSIVAHLVMSARSAWKASLVMLAATLTISLAWLTTRVGSGELLAQLGRILAYEAILGVSMIMLYALAKSKDDHAEALIEAARMRDMAYVDKVTGLPNRRRLDEDLERQLAVAERHDQALSVVLFDIDKFKKVNDDYGHPVGDEVLEELGRAVRPLLRSGDVFGRWGGEEFMIVAPETDEAQVLALAERVRHGIERHAFPAGVRITASFGVATRRGATTADALIDRADVRLYEAKAAGRNRVVGGAGADGSGTASDGAAGAGG